MLNRPRFGLALSGGGFRAAFFHLGVLARLAEMDALRHVELISTVSGGSILGALYYLHIKELLESTGDAQIGARHFVQILQSLEVEFLAKVQQNIRMRAFANPWANLKMAVRQDYSRSDRLGELYDEVFYRPALQRKNPGEEGPVLLPELLITPAEHRAEANFHPAAVNPARQAKVPMLFLNATSLNTGRHWLFTPTWMGEHFDSEMAWDECADVNAVLKGLYYSEAAVPRYQRFPVGAAVAASASVPGLFAPLPLAELYRDWSVELVDGGVHDNQGIAVLDQYGCEAVLVSDGSGLMQDAKKPLPFVFDVLNRSSNVLTDRVRDIEISEVLARSSTRPGLVLHLREGLPPPQIEPRKRDAPDPVERTPETAEVTDYGVQSKVQGALSRLRTDLDAFCDIEADALMASGYRMAAARLVEKSALAQHLKLRSFPPVEGCGFRFRWIFPELRNPSRRVTYVLAVGEDRLFKTLSVYIPKKIWQLAALIGLLAILFFSPVFTAAISVNLRPAFVLIGIGATFLFLTTLPEVRRRGQKLTLGILTVLCAWEVVQLYLLLLNPLYLFAGRRPRGSTSPAAGGSCR